MSDKFALPSRFKTSRKDSIFTKYQQLCLDYNPLDLGLGFPDFPPPKNVTETLALIARSDNSLHQYTRDYGHPRLVTALSSLYSGLINRQIDPQSEILTTVGAQEALFASIYGHVDVGDEVVIFEPFLECYETLVRSVGGVPRFVPLFVENGTWKFDQKVLESIINSKTKVLILNNPNNPCGKVYTLEELKFLAQLCQKWNVLCISDESLEWIVYKPKKHIRMAGVSGMWDRTITIGSAEESFSVTGWKLGWVYGPSNLLYNLLMVHQNSVYTGNTPIQETIAICLEKELEKLNQPDCYFKHLPAILEEKRDFLVKSLNEIGFPLVVPEGGYFLTVDWTFLEHKIDLKLEQDSYKDERFTKWMVKNMKLLGMPLSPFFSEDNKVESYVRFCFFKKDETLEEAVEIMKRMVTL